jgi:hypothetical protein
MKPKNIKMEWILLMLYFPLALFLIIPKEAVGNNVTLPIQKETSDFGHWCWAATSTMVINRYIADYPEWPTDTDTDDCNYLGQCGVVNRHLGRSDCCPASDVYQRWMDSDPNPCDTEEVVSDVLDEWGIDNTPKGVLSFNQIKTEIDAGRPFIVKWTWSGSGTCSGNHYVIGVAYDDSINWVEIIDPNPIDECNGYQWMSYDDLKYDNTEGKSCYHTWSATDTMDNSPTLNTLHLRCVDQVDNPLYDIDGLYVFDGPGDIHMGDNAVKKEFHVVENAYIVVETTSSNKIFMEKGCQIDRGAYFHALRY